MPENYAYAQDHPLHTLTFTHAAHIAHVFEIQRDYFLMPENYASCRSVLVARFGELMRKVRPPLPAHCSSAAVVFKASCAHTCMLAGACSLGSQAVHSLTHTLSHTHTCFCESDYAITTHTHSFSHTHHPPDVEPLQLQGPGVAPRVHAGRHPGQQAALHNRQPGVCVGGGPCVSMCVLRGQVDAPGHTRSLPTH